MIDVIIFLFTGFILLVGWLIRNHHSEYPDTFCGYHVGKIAPKSAQAWEDANRWCGNLLLLSGAVFLLLDVAAVGLFHALRAAETLWVLPFSYLMATLLVPLVFGIAVTEHRLRKTYDPDGTPNGKGQL